MKWNNVAILGAAATAYAQDKAPKESAPEGCKASYDGTFTISVVEASGDSSKLKRDGSCPEGSLLVTLKDGVLKDAQDRTGNIVANYQFQFDAPLQDNAIYTSGFSVCDDRTLAIGGNKTFYQCLSGDFYNLYDRDWAEQCKPINIITTSCSGGGSSGGEVPPASQIPDGQVQAPSAVPLPVSQIGDGQVQVPSGAPVSQIPDGQVQAPTGAPVSQIPDGQVQAPTGAPVSQIPDGQVQAPTGAPISQIGDGQIQAPTAISTATIPLPPATTPAPSPTPGPVGGALQMAPSAGLLVAALGAVLLL
jgi:hypothetical protein